MYKGWKPAGCRGWPVPRRGYGYGAVITHAQFKQRRDDADADDLYVFDNINAEIYEKKANIKYKV